MTGLRDSGVAQTVIVCRPGRTRGFRLRLDAEPVLSGTGNYVRLRGFRVRKDGTEINWTQAFVPVKSVSSVEGEEGSMTDFVTRGVEPCATPPSSLCALLPRRGL